MIKTIRYYANKAFLKLQTYAFLPLLWRGTRSGIIGLCCFFLFSSFTWRTYLSYDSPQEIVQANTTLFYVRASNSLYSYDTKDQSVRTFDKVNGLSDCNITHIAYNKAAHRLVVAYENQNID